MIKTFELLAKPFKDGEGGLKLNALQEIFPEGIWEPGIGFIVNKQENPSKVVVSHIDLIKTFRKGFADNHVYAVTETEIIGALDNTITNAALVLAIKSLSDFKTIEYVFTEGEEVGFKGMKAYIKKYKRRVINSFFINLDVTNEGYGRNGSIEYDVCNFETLKSLQTLVNTKNLDWHFTHSRVGDDTDAIIDAGLHGFSYCLPTKGHIHSYENRALLSSLDSYLEGLICLIKHDLNPGECNVKSWQFKDALITDIFENLKINEPASRYYTSPWFSDEEDIQDDNLGERIVNTHEIFGGYDFSIKVEVSHVINSFYDFWKSTGHSSKKSLQLELSQLGLRQEACDFIFAEFEEVEFLQDPKKDVKILSFIDKIASSVLFNSFKNSVQFQILKLATEYYKEKILDAHSDKHSKEFLKIIKDEKKSLEIEKFIEDLINEETSEIYLIEINHLFNECSFAYQLSNDVCEKIYGFLKQDFLSHVNDFNYKGQLKQELLTLLTERQASEVIRNIEEYYMEFF